MAGGAAAAAPAGAQVTELTLSGLRKTYGETRALDGLDLVARPGEVLGIAGPNGAGKSTLVRVLAGEDVEDGGELRLDGRPWTLADRRGSVALVHQEPKLFPTLTVAENLLVGAERTRFARPAPAGAEQEVSAELGLGALTGTAVEDCSLVAQQLVEIARAVLRDARVFLFDEPNSALTAEESERLFSHIRRLRAEGRCVVMLITHRLTDLVEYCDRVAIVRDGRVTDVLSGERLTTHNLGQAVAGGQVGSDVGPGDGPRVEAGEPLLRCRGWSDHAGSTFAGIDLEVRAGEALVITGQEGAGGRELMRSLAGLRAAKGTLEMGPQGGARDGRRPLAYVPADRGISLFQNMSVAGNLAARLGRGKIASPLGLLSVRSVMSRGRALVERLRVRTASERTPIGGLSGGNQQKIAVGAALACEPRVLIVEEPTRGVDVGTKEEIYSSLRDYVAQGNALITFSPELDDMVRLADTARVIVGGRLSEPIRMTDVGSLEELAAWVDRVAVQGG